MWSKTYIGLHVKCPLSLFDFSETFDRISKNTQLSNFIKIRPVGAEVYTHRWTDMTKLIATFSQLKKKNMDQGEKDRSSGDRKVGADLPPVDYWPNVVFATVFTTS